MTELIGKERVIVYVDGFNFYFGLKESGFERYLWLNTQELVKRLLKPNQDLVHIKYFTALVTNNTDKRLRQKTYFQALSSLKDLTVYYGKFQNQEKKCGVCGNTYTDYGEKMTDVGIATQILKDAFQDKFDMAMLISGDTDLIPPIRIVNEEIKGKRVFVAFPPNRSNDHVRSVASGSMTIGRKNLAESQFNDTVIIDAEGNTVLRPGTWV